jgi:hypothetical protein
MRLGSLLIVLAACSSPAAAGPAWPKSTPHETDGGESLAPRAAARPVAARDPGDKPPDRATTDKPVATPGNPAAPADHPAAASPVASPSDEPVTTEDIVIEIED